MMNKYCQPDSPDSVNDLNDSKRIDIVSSYCDKMTSPNAYPSPDPSSSPFVYYPSANMFEVGLQSSPDINTVDPASPVHLLAPTPSHAHPKSSVCSPASSMRSTPTAGQYPVTYAATPSSKKKVCDTCKKAFNRRCDLNRHNKTHERPFKCQSEGCEYQTRGFPTDQERKRHLNDRHSDAPVIYDCTWEGCNYSSKRESNLKQHKEKAHDWKYDRSRPNNRSRTGQSRDLTKDDIQLSSTGTSPFPAPSTYPLQIPVRSQAVPPFAGSDVTSSLDYTNASRFDHQHDSNNALFMMGTHITNHGVYTEQLGMGATTPVHVAWEEPATENQLSNFLVSTESQHDSFSTTHPSHHNQQGHAPHSWTYNNPDLLSPAHGTHAPVVPSTPNAIPAPCLGQYPFAGPVAAMPFAGRPMVPSSSLPILQDVLAGDTSQAAGTQSVSSPAALYVSGPSSSLLNPKQNAHTGRTSKRGMGTSCHEGHRRNNRSPSHLIPGTSIPFDEDSMPCPFRVTDPAYYSRVNQERFSPCHTEHRYISTLFRHLSRAAHSLAIDKNSLSSFGVDVSLRLQPHAGLCRNCWRVFYDRSAFEQHTSHASQCHGTSRSKMEKYNIIRQTFCSPPYGGFVSSGSISPPPLPSQPPSSPPDLESAPDDDSDDGLSSHGSPPPPEAVQNESCPGSTRAVAAAYPVPPQADPQLYDNSRRLQEVIQSSFVWDRRSNRLEYHVSSLGKTAAELVNIVSSNYPVPADPDVDMEIVYDPMLNDMDGQEFNDASVVGRQNPDGESSNTLGSDISSIDPAATMPHITSIHHVQPHGWSTQTIPGLSAPIQTTWHGSAYSTGHTASHDPAAIAHKSCGDPIQSMFPSDKPTERRAGR